MQCLAVPHQEKTCTTTFCLAMLISDNTEFGTFLENIQEAVRNEKFFYKFVTGGFSARIETPCFSFRKKKVKRKASEARLRCDRLNLIVVIIFHHMRS